MSSTAYRPEIDGLRAVAVLPVIFFHMGIGWLPGGFAGVDVFFIISGFLISSIVLKDYDRGEFSFANFWARRVRRILPVLVAMVLATTVAGYFLLYAPEIVTLATTGVATLLSFANFLLWDLAGNYWGADAEDLPFLHTWSLSVEEQFYLLFPLTIVALLKFFRKGLVPAVVAFIVTSLLLFFYGAHMHPGATFYLLPTRAWELGFGCLLAVLTHERGASFRGSTVLSAIGLIAIVGSYFVIDGEDGISTLLVVPVVGSVLIIAFSSGGENWIRRVLSIAPVVYIGKISYSLYIWHWPVLVLAKSWALGAEVVFSPLYAVLPIFALSIASYHFIEQPTRRNSKTVPIVLAALFVSVACLALLSTSKFTEDISRYNTMTWNGRLYEMNPARVWPRAEMGVVTPEPGPSVASAYGTGGITKLYGKETPDLVLLGDSHALMWSGMLDELCRELGVSVAFYGAANVNPFTSIPIQKRSGEGVFSSDLLYAFDESKLDHLKKWKPKVVVIAVRWSSTRYIRDAVGTRDLIEFLGQIGSKVLLVEQPPELFFRNRSAAQFLSYLGLEAAAGARKYVPVLDNAAYQEGRDLIRRLSEEHPHVEYAPIAEIFMEDDRAWVLEGPDVLYFDDDHLSHSGTLKAKSSVRQSLRRLADW